MSKERRVVHPRGGHKGWDKREKLTTGKTTNLALAKGLGKEKKKKKRGEKEKSQGGT